MFLWDRSMKLNKLLKKLQINHKLKGNIKKLSIFSDLVDKNTAFIALKGQYHDGLKEMTKEQLDRVGVVFSYEEFYHPKIIYIQNLRYRLSQLVSILYPKLLKNVFVIGVCGTCGKTTTATMLFDILYKANHRVLYMGTHRLQYQNDVTITNNTTLNPIEFINYYQKLKEKPEFLILEVSSHAILENRINFIDFNALIYTNFSQDHLDYHLNMKNYFNVKRSLFKSIFKRSVAIINIDDTYSKELIANIHSNIITYGLKKGKYSLKDYCNEQVLAYNQYNMLAAYAMASYLKIQSPIIEEALNHYSFELGRSQVVYDNKFKVIIDYAHTPMALKNLLIAIYKQYHQPITLVFGCGGNRDQEKRKIMGKIAAQYANKVILTNDNPRDENPLKIIHDIKKGCIFAKVIPNRKEAIDYSIKNTKEKEIVLIVGKGNENYQIINNQKVPFSDYDYILESVNRYE